MVLNSTLLSRLRLVSEDDLVDALRRIHRGEPVARERATERVDGRHRADESDHHRNDNASRSGNHSDHSNNSDDDPYERARRHFRQVETRLEKQAQLTDRVIDQLRAARGREVEGPAVQDGENDDLLRVLREAQFLLLRHPEAGQAFFSAVVAEGRRFAATEEGRRWQERLAGSPLMRKGRAVWEVATLEMLEEKPATTLPSVYLDMLVKASEQPGVEPLLLKLYGIDPDENDEADSRAG